MNTSQNKQRQWPWTAAVLAVSAHFAITYDWTHSSFLRLQEYADGRATLPYQARILMAWILHVASKTASVSTMAAHAPLQLRDPYVLVQTLCVFLAVAAATLATRATITTLTGDSEFARFACFLLPLMAYFNLVLDYGLSYTLPYDLPSLAFFCGGILLIVRKQWVLYYPLFVTAMLNRETAIFLAVVLACWEWADASGSANAERVRRILLHTSLQVVIAVTIKLWLRHHFAANATEGNGNGLFSTAIRTNVHSLMNPGQWPLFLSLFAFLPVPLWLGRRYVQHRALSLATAVTVPLWIAAMFVVGVVVEVRVFNELASLLALIAAMEAYHCWVQPRPTETA